MTGAGVPGATALAELLSAPGTGPAGKLPGPWAGLASLDLRCAVPLSLSLSLSGLCEFRRGGIGLT